MKNLKDVLIAVIPVLSFFTLALTLGYANLAPFDLKKFLHFLLLAPILEEIIFRGTFQRMVYEKYSYKFLGITFANFAISAIFATIHLLTTTPLNAFLIFFPSIVFGLIYDRNKSIYPCIIVHAIYNLNVFIIYL